LSGTAVEPFLRRTAAIAYALDLALQIYYTDPAALDEVENA